MTPRPVTTRPVKHHLVSHGPARHQACILAFAGLLGLALASGGAGAGVTVCVEPGEALALRVSFASLAENAVLVADGAGRRIAGFNSHHAQGAGAEWTLGAGEWHAPPQAVAACFQIDGQHKAGPPDAARPWIASACRVARTRIGFEDGDDGDYDDARVEVITGRIDAVTPPCKRELASPSAARKNVLAKPMPRLEPPVVLKPPVILNGPIVMRPEPKPMARPEAVAKPEAMPRTEVMARTEVDLERQARLQVLEKRSAEAARQEQLKLLERRSAELQRQAVLAEQRQARMQAPAPRVAEIPVGTPPVQTSASVSQAVTSVVPDPAEARVARLDAYLANLKQAAYTFNPPSPIKVAKPVTVHFWLDPKASPAALAAELKALVPEDAARVEAGLTKRSEEMEASLRGDEFEIKPITPERQLVSASERTVWEWSVSPKRPGKSQRLYLTLNVVLPPELGGPRTQKTFDKRIDVEVTPMWLFDTYFEKYGTWALGGLGPLLVGAFGWWWKKRHG